MPKNDLQRNFKQAMSSINARSAAGDYSALCDEVRHLCLDAQGVPLRGEKSLNTFAHLAAEEGSTQLMGILVHISFPLELENQEGKRPLHLAAQNCHLDATRILLEADVDVDPLKRGDWTPLMLACTSRSSDCSSLEIVELLLEHGANPALCNKDGWTAFHIAAREGSTSVLKSVLSRAPEAWKTHSNNGRTPLHTAALHGRYEALKGCLLDNAFCQYTPDEIDNCGNTPFTDALRGGFVNVARLLRSCHLCNCRIRDKTDRSSIHLAAQAGQSISLRYLVHECRIDVNETSPYGTAMHCAAKEGNLSALKELLALGANMELLNSSGQTCLHVAAGANKRQCVQLLIERGANQNAVDSQGRRPRDTTTRGDAGDRSLASVAIHEISHSWTGNLVTTANWQHFWLNEGFTMFVERKIIKAMEGEKVRQMSLLIGRNGLQQEVDTRGAGSRWTALVPDLTDTNPDDAFGLVPYEKGCALLYYLEEKVGGADVMDGFLRAYVEHFKHETLTTEEWKSFFLHYFADKTREGVFDDVNWHEWLYFPGMPPILSSFDRTLYDAAVELANRWSVWTGTAREPSPFEAEDIAQFVPMQTVCFLDELLKKDLFSADKLDAMADCYGFFKVKNSEIRFRWLHLCVKSQYVAAIQPALDFVNEQGRMKFCRPLYRALHASKDEAVQKQAKDNFLKNCNHMNSIAAKMISKDLGLEQ